ncbi:MAG: mRNA surveillance protein pelota [Candidatus Altarchaeaceae archaeon]
MKFLSPIPNVSEKEQELKVKIESYDDLWWLSNLISEGDCIEGKTERRTTSNLGECEKSERKPVFIKLLVEKLNFNGKILHVVGKILSASDDEIPLNSYHSFNIQIDDIIKIEKIFDENSIEILKEIKECKKNLIVVIDRGIANIAVLNDVNVEYYEISKNISGKLYESKREKEIIEFYEEVLNFLKKIYVENIILAGPGFEKENFYNYLKEKDKEIARKIIIEDVGSEGINGIKEVISKGKKILKDINFVKDQEFIEKLMYEISKDGLYCYSLQDVINAVNYGAVEILLITNKFFSENRKELQEILKEVRNKGGKIHIIDSRNEAGQQLDSLGGIAGILRFKI